MPRFGPMDRRSVYPIYKPAVPGYVPPQSTEPEDGDQPEQHDAGHLPPSDEDEGSKDGPEPDQGQALRDNGSEEQIGEGGELEAGNTREPTHNSTRMHRGAPPPADAQPPRGGDPWQILRYDRVAARGGNVVTDHMQMPSDLKRQVDWSIMGSRHPKGASFREWDDRLEEQNPWHQGGRPILKQ
jgi:hypothetical protein